MVSCAFLGTGFRPRRTTARANISGVNSGVSEKSIWLSCSASTRFQSVRDFKVADFFMLRCLPDGDDAYYFLSLDVCDNNHSLLEQAQGDEPGLAIINPVIQHRN